MHLTYSRLSCPVVNVLYKEVHLDTQPIHFCLCKLLLVKQNKTHVLAACKCCPLGDYCGYNILTSNTKPLPALIFLESYHQVILTVLLRNLPVLF